jgi:hypothetical protein
MKRMRAMEASHGGFSEILGNLIEVLTKYNPKPKFKAIGLLEGV